MGHRIRWIIQEEVDREWKLACARDTLPEIVRMWEDTYLPVVAQIKRENMIVRRGGYLPNITPSRTFRLARVTPNAITIVDPADHSQHHRLEMRKLELEAR